MLEVWRDALPATWQNFGPGVVLGFFPAYSRTKEDLPASDFSVLSPQVF